MIRFADGSALAHCADIVTLFAAAPEMTPRKVIERELARRMVAHQASRVGGSIWSGDGPTPMSLRWSPSSGWEAVLASHRDSAATVALRVLHDTAFLPSHIAGPFGSKAMQRLMRPHSEADRERILRLLRALVAKHLRTA